MKRIGRILSIALILAMMTTSCYGAILWTKLYSSADDGSTYSGANIGTMQGDISDQVATTAGDNVYTGANTFNGAIAFGGAVTGISAAKDAITRGFELVYGSVEQAIVNVGTLYHGTTQVNKTANTHIDVTTAADYITGVSEQAVSIWLYIYVDPAGNVKLDDDSPDKSDASGDTEGVHLYYYYATSSTYYRCIGAIYLNATGSGEIDKWYQRKDLVMWDVPVSVTTTVSAGVWSGAIATRMPAISTLGLFGMKANENGGASFATYIRPAGGVWATNNQNGIAGNADGVTNLTISGQRHSATDNSQQIQVQNDSGDESTAVDIEGYYLNIR